MGSPAIWVKFRHSAFADKFANLCTQARFDNGMWPNVSPDPAWPERRVRVRTVAGHDNMHGVVGVTLMLVALPGAGWICRAVTV